MKIIFLSFGSGANILKKTIKLSTHLFKLFNYYYYLLKEQSDYLQSAIGSGDLALVLHSWLVLFRRSRCLSAAVAAN